MKKKYKRNSSHKILKALLIVLMIQIATSCSYEFSEDYYKEINQEVPTATLALSDFTDNTVLYDPLNILFNYQGNNRHRLYEIKIYIDDNLIKTSEIETGEFLIDIDTLEDGLHTLKVEYLFSSGSGSLADISNLEGYITTKEYDFFVDKSPPETIQMKNVELIDGSIYVNWEAPSKLNFKKIIFAIKSNGDALSYEEWTIDDLTQNIYHETFFTRTNLEYSIYVENRYGSSISNEVSLSTEEIVIRKEIINENQFKLICPKHPIYNNFDFYSYDFQGSSYRISSQGGEAIINIAPIFPFENGSYLINLIDENGDSKGSLSDRIYYSKQYDSNYFHYYYDVVFSEIEGSYFGLQPKRTGPGFTIKKFNGNSFELVSDYYINVEDYSVGDLTVDPVSNNLILKTSGNSYLLNHSSLSVIDQWTNSEFNNSTGEVLYRNGMIIIVEENQLHFYNSTTKTLFYSINKSGYFKISDNGHYFFVNNVMYKIENQVVETLSSNFPDSSNEVKSMEFILNKQKCVYTDFNGNPAVFDLVTKGHTTINGISEVTGLQYDKITKKLMLYQIKSNGQKSFIQIYDFDTEIFKKLEVYGQGNVTEYEQLYLNGKLLSLDGWYLDHYLN